MIQTGRARSTSDRSTNPVKNRAAESRLDPLTGNWTIFAPGRVQRPEELVDQHETTNIQVACPFCPGNEMETPPSVWVGRVSDGETFPDVTDAGDEAVEPWSVRVVPNRFPALSPIDGSDSPKSDSELFQRGPIRGGHEVIIESRQHVRSLSELDLAEVLLVFQAYRDRLRYWRSIPGIAYVTAFKNVGRKAGASLRHAHSQLIATDRMPPAVQETMDRMARHRAATGCCLQCDLIRAEMKSNQRIIWHDDTLVAYCPFASHMPWLVRITTLKHEASFEDLDEPTLESVSRIVSRVVSWLEQLLPGTAYNLCLHTCPPGAPSDSFHWAIEIFPRTTQIGGFEWSSQCMINTVLPEVAANKLRGCVLAEDPRLQL